MYRETILIGAIISLIYTEWTGVSAGLIVPGYIVLSVSSPRRIIYTFLLALLAFVICRLLDKFVILYGRRRFVVLLVVCYFLDLVVKTFLSAYYSNPIGLIIPGILAKDYDRQGIAATTISIVVVSGILWMIVSLMR